MNAPINYVDILSLSSHTSRPIPLPYPRRPAASRRPPPKTLNHVHMQPPLCAQHHGPMMGAHGPVILRLCLSTRGTLSHQRSYHTWPGCLLTQHQMLA